MPPPYMSGPTTNDCALWDATFSTLFLLDGLYEPTTIPELVTQPLMQEYMTRPGQVTGGNRVWAVWPARANYGEISIEFPLLELEEADLLRDWQFNDPPVAHFTNDGGLTVYKGIIASLIRKPFRMFGRQVMSASMTLKILGEVGSHGIS